jgi:signal transduction histidine kinase
LYPAKLRLIGLVPALLALQREMERSEVVVNLVYEDVPSSLPPDLTLCLFRVVQEALQNAVKHSGAREISVRLSGGDEGLTLTIADDGTGFDVEPAMGSGLGLISMRERLEAIGGTLKIHSAPTKGTRIVVCAPLGIERLSEAVVSGRA